MNIVMTRKEWERSAAIYRELKSEACRRTADRIDAVLADPKNAKKSNLMIPDLARPRQDARVEGEAMVVSVISGDCREVMTELTPD